MLVGVALKSHFAAALSIIYSQCVPLMLGFLFSPNPVPVGGTKTHKCHTHSNSHSPFAIPSLFTANEIRINVTSKT